MSPPKAIGDLASAPTLSADGTRDGVLLGSAPYMSPEQAAGRAVDARTDIWAFGCVAYEVLTGEAAFRGDSVAETLAAVLTREPAWTRLPPTVPARMRAIVERCLRKDPRHRLHAIADARLELEDMLGSESTRDPDVRAAARRHPRLVYAVAVSALTALAVIGALWLRDRPSGVTFPVYASIDAPPGYVLGEDDLLVSLPTRTPTVFTPDGKALIIQAASDHKPQ